MTDSTYPMENMDLSSVLTVALGDLLHANRVYAGVIADIRKPGEMTECGEMSFVPGFMTTREVAECVCKLSERVRLQADVVAGLISVRDGGDECGQTCGECPPQKVDARDQARKPVHNNWTKCS